MVVAVTYTNLIAIGDIHGMADTLELLLSDLQSRFEPADTIFVFLGDLVDRGPDTRSAVELVMRVVQSYPGSVFIMGNHDEFVFNLARLSLPWDEIAQWAQLGGLPTLLSYGLTGRGDLVDDGNEFNEKFPEHAQFFRSTVDYFETDRHYFAHAGIDPEFPLSDQYAVDLRWIRDEFLTHTEPYEKVVVHGHSITPSELPEVHSNRIALDTGSYRTGRISAAVFKNDYLSGFTVAEVTEAGSKVRYFDAEVKEVAS